MSIFNPLDPADCTLLPQRVDVWQYGLHSLYPAAEALLSDDERARANRYHFARHKRRFIMARAILRYILAKYTQEPANQLMFKYQSRGKPELIHPSTLQFNLSHSKDQALLAIGQRFPLGVDLEFFSDRSYVGIGTQVFSPHENQQLKQAPEALKPFTFFNVWAQKEAFIKACGLGLSYPTEKIDMPPLPQGLASLVDPIHQTHWKMLSFSPMIDCCAALCYHPEVNTLRYACLDNPYEKNDDPA